MQPNVKEATFAGGLFFYLPSTSQQKEHEQSNSQEHKRAWPDPEPAIAAVTTDNDAA